MGAISRHLLWVTILLLAVGSTARAQNDPLPSWNDGPTKRALVDFVNRVTKEGGPDFVPVNQRIATFDNDGTLWSEQPIYFQFQFALDRVKTLAPQHPEWKATEPFNHLLAGDMKTFMAGGEKSLMAVLMTAHSGMTTDEFDQTVKDWLRTAKHPKTGRAYNQMVYQPMLEVLAYLRANNFKTFIVSGGGVEFLRAFAEETYGIPPEQVIGSQGKLKFEMRNGQPVLVKLPETQFIDDKEGKPIGIETFIGRRPIAAFGNSDGDLQMLQWITAGSGPRFGLIVHHTDAEREWAYDRSSSIGKLDKALDEALARKWIVVDMKQDWKVIYPAASGEQVEQTVSLVGKKWRLKKLNGILIEQSKAYLEFDAKAQRFSGSGGCNRIAGGYKVDGGQIKFSQVISTKMACVGNDVQKVENDFLKALGEVTGFQVQGDGLILLQSGKPTLTFSAI